MEYHGILMGYSWNIMEYWWDIHGVLVVTLGLSHENNQFKSSRYPPVI
jgi:hypothetical protein